MTTLALLALLAAPVASPPSASPTTPASGPASESPTASASESPTVQLSEAPAEPSTAPEQPTTQPSEPPSEASSSPPSVRSASDRFGGFVDLHWRVLGLGGHVSHGPGFAAGAILFRHFQVGVAGFARPGPINPKTFDVTLPDGETYRGQSTVRLRSDGTVIGLMLGARFDLPKAPLSIEIPVMVGYGGFGFYLHDEDRQTPDGRRVSEWEDELLDGRDSDPVNLVVDAGIRLAWTPRRESHFRPFVGAHYTQVIGYDTAVLSEYSGFSGAVGVQFGKFPGRR